jgi:hypothetical protein
MCRVITDIRYYLFVYTGSDLGDDDDICSEDEDSDDSYTTQEEFTTELILGYLYFLL